MGKELYRYCCLLVVMMGAATASCLVRSWCLNDGDCDGNERCDVEQGICFLECSADGSGSCPTERTHCLVSENRCVECLESRHCATSESCVGGRCLADEAPDFSLLDENPSSPSFGRVVSLGEHRGEVVLLFFATLG